MGISKKELEKNKVERTGIEKLNKQGSLMKIIEYNGTQNIIIEFQDKYKYKKKTTWCKFLDGQPINPYHPTIFNIGMQGLKNKHSEHKKEYKIWYTMMRRCYDEEYKKEHPTYENVTCCEEWLLFDNFCEWLNNQKNFDKWLSNKYWNLDKDILLKGNKIYCPEYCCLVPQNVNTLFVKKDANRGTLPIGVCYSKKDKRYIAVCSNPLKSKTNRYVGSYGDPIEAFYAYKKEKECVIKLVAQEEYDKGNITKKCYDAMMSYQVEITD